MGNLEPGKWDPMLWVDLETTGLNPRKDSILEIGAIITDEDLNEVASFKQVWPFSKLQIPNWSVNDVVIQMHTDNGLWDACDLVYAKGTDPYDCWANFIIWVNKSWKWTDSKIILAGSGVHFDKEFLMNRVYRHGGTWFSDNLHYRVFDVSTLKRFWTGAGHPPPELESRHRAMPDVEDALVMTQTLMLGIKTLTALANAY